MTGPESKTQQELADEFHMMVGYCIAKWARVDDELFQIFRDCIGPYEQSAIIYYRTPGLDLRFGLTSEIVMSILPKPQKPGVHEHPSVKAWKTATDDFENLLSTRRRIAHQPVKMETGRHQFAGPFNTTLFNTLPPSWFEIYVNQHERLRKRSAKLPPLRIPDLKSHLIAVDSLAQRLNHFYHTVLTKRAAESPPSSSLPTPPESQK